MQQSVFLSACQASRPPAAVLLLLLHDYYTACKEEFVVGYYLHHSYNVLHSMGVGADLCCCSVFCCCIIEIAVSVPVRGFITGYCCTEEVVVVLTESPHSQHTRTKTNQVIRYSHTKCFTTCCRQKSILSPVMNGTRYEENSNTDIKCLCCVCRLHTAGYKCERRSTARRGCSERLGVPTTNTTQQKHLSLLTVSLQVCCLLLPNSQFPTYVDLLNHSDNRNQTTTSLQPVIYKYIFLVNPRVTISLISVIIIIIIISSSSSTELQELYNTAAAVFSVICLLSDIEETMIMTNGTHPVGMLRTYVSVCTSYHI